MQNILPKAFPLVCKQRLDSLCGCRTDFNKSKQFFPIVLKFLRRIPVLFKTVPPLSCAKNNRMVIFIFKGSDFYFGFLIRSLDLFFYQVNFYSQVHSNSFAIISWYLLPRPSLNHSGWSQNHMAYAACLLFPLIPFYRPFMDPWDTLMFGIINLNYINDMKMAWHTIYSILICIRFVHFWSFKTKQIKRNLLC